MKSEFLKLCICGLFLTSFILAKANLESLNGNNFYKFLWFLGSDVLGEASSDGSVTKGAITYSLGSDGGYALKDDTVRNIL